MVEIWENKSEHHNNSQEIVTMLIRNKFPALHSKEIFYDDEKRRYSIGDRTRRDVDVR